MRYPLAKEGVFAPGGYACIAHVKQRGQDNVGHLDWICDDIMMFLKYIRKRGGGSVFSNCAIFSCIYYLQTFYFFDMRMACPITSLARLSTGFVFSYFVQTEGLSLEIYFRSNLNDRTLIFFCKKAAH